VSLARYIPGTVPHERLSRIHRGIGTGPSSRTVDPASPDLPAGRDCNHEIVRRDLSSNDLELLPLAGKRTVSESVGTITSIDIRARNQRGSAEHQRADGSIIYNVNNLDTAGRQARLQQRHALLGGSDISCSLHHLRGALALKTSVTKLAGKGRRNVESQDTSTLDGADCNVDIAHAAGLIDLDELPAGIRRVIARRNASEILGVQGRRGLNVVEAPSIESSCDSVVPIVTNRLAFFQGNSRLEPNPLREGSGLFGRGIDSKTRHSFSFILLLLFSTGTK